MIYRPMYMDRIMAYTDTPFVKVLTGVRRSGKSTILRMIAERLRSERNVPAERIHFFRFDSMEYEDMTAKQMYSALKACLSGEGKTYLFLDEVQEIDGWEKVVNSLAADFDVDLYVTGSNSRLMSSEISTYLTGRYVSFRVYTLSFAEFLMFRESYGESGDAQKELAEYVMKQGLESIHALTFTPSAVKGWKDAQVTSGGVDLGEIDPDTCESRMQPGLYITGELLDYDGPCGGYNLSNAWLTGLKAARSIANTNI